MQQERHRRVRSTEWLAVMKVSIPAEEKEVCDTCEREGHLTTCLVCGKQFCLLCQCYLVGCMVRPDVCKKCDDRDDVQQIAKQYGLKILKLTNKRDVELEALNTANDALCRPADSEARAQKGQSK